MNFHALATEIEALCRTWPGCREALVETIARKLKADHAREDVLAHTARLEARGEEGRGELHSFPYIPIDRLLPNVTTWPDQPNLAKMTDKQIEAFIGEQNRGGKAVKYVRKPDGRVVFCTWPLGKTCPFPDDWHAAGEKEKTVGPLNELDCNNHNSPLWNQFYNIK